MAATQPAPYGARLAGNPESPCNRRMDAEEYTEERQTHRDPIMPIRVKCDACKKTLSVKDHLAGKRIKCPLCQAIIIIPSAGAAQDTPGGAKPAPAAQKPAPGIPAPVPGAARTTKPAAKPKPKPTTNGTPAPKTKEPVALPPEDLEKEALSAWADEPPTTEEVEAPTTIDFVCQWCDEMLHLPLDLGGKQTQCPNEECRRIIKVPMPKMPEKQDWRKVKIGPGGALTNQPDELDNAWGTEQTTRARQDSLAQAGAISALPKPSRGWSGWMYLAFVSMVLFIAIGAATFGGVRLVNNQQSVNALRECKNLLDPTKDPKIKDPLLQAEAHRVIALLTLSDGKGKNAGLDAADNFSGALSLISDSPSVNEQMFLLDLTRSLIELGGNEDEVSFRRTKRSWDNVRGLLRSALEKCNAPEVQVAGLRAVATRLIAVKQDDLALVLADGLANTTADKGAARSPAYRQAIALRIFRGDDKKADAKIKRPEPKDDKAFNDAHARIGYAEGFARKGELDDALKLAMHKGPLVDRFDACIGIAGVLMADAKQRDKAGQFVKEAITLSKEKGSDKLTPWQILLLTRLAARTEEADTVKALVEQQKDKFKLRSQLEILLATCEKSNTVLEVEALSAFENDDKEGQTLALAWFAFTTHNAKHGRNRTQNRQTFESRATIAGLTEPTIEMIRPMVDLGTHLGSLKFVP